MIRINNPADCCGCTACESVCPHHAISMKPDALGFLYPEVNAEKCTDCGLCERVCAFNENYDTSLNFTSPKAYGARHKNMEEVATSRSGAAFIALSDWIFQQGGVVYGAGYAEHFRVVHKRATTPTERNEFKGSKYVQSDLRGVFKQVKQDLKNGLIVMFSGTPCQTAGLNSFIGTKLRKKLYLVDIVCHGAPAPKVWDEYLSYLEKKHNSAISWVNFRDKQLFGWRAHRETFKFIKFGGGKKMSFTFVFYKHIMFRHSCGNCHYCNTHRPSDITIADFWGWEKTNPEFNKDDKGVSLVLINTVKGEHLFNAVKHDLNIFPAKLENCLQPNLIKPSEIHPHRMQFEQDFQRKGIKYVLHKYGEEGWRYKLKMRTTDLRHIIGKILRVLHLR